MVRDSANFSSWCTVLLKPLHKEVMQLSIMSALGSMLLQMTWSSFSHKLSSVSTITLQAAGTLVAGEFLISWIDTPQTKEFKLKPLKIWLIDLWTLSTQASLHRITCSTTIHLIWVHQKKERSQISAFSQAFTSFHSSFKYWLSSLGLLWDLYGTSTFPTHS